MKEKLRSIIEDNTSVYGKLFDYFIFFLIFTSLIVFSIETLPGLSPERLGFLRKIDLVCIIIFSIEYLLRIYVSKNPLKYIFSFYGLIDLVAVLPFYLHLGIDLRSLRAFRIFRLVKALEITRYSRALKRLKIAAKLIREEIVLFFLLSGILIFLTATGIYYFEHEAQPEKFSSIFHSLWWAVVTLTTVGYGDVYPITAGGKIFTFFVLIIGVAIVTVPAGLVASSINKARKIEQRDLESEHDSN